MVSLRLLQRVTRQRWGGGGGGGGGGGEYIWLPGSLLTEAVAYVLTSLESGELHKCKIREK